MLYVPIAQLDCVGKYVCDDGAKPKVNTLGSKEWEKTKTKVKTHVKEIAKELMLLYAKREKMTGFAYEKDTPWQKEFEDSFCAETIVYETSTIGARDGSFVADLGAAYVWQETNKIRNDDRISVNNNELEESIESINRRSKDGEGGFTKKMKSVILADKD